MNQRTWKTMTDEERRIKVAELCGIEVVSDGITHHLMPCNLDARAYVKDGKYLCVVPDYLNDLNALHKIEIELLAQNNITTLHYVNNLAKVVGLDGFDVFATAAQRAEAIALTLEPE